MIDDVDLKILSIIQKDARISNVELARRLGKAPSAILERIRKLNNRDIISEYVARINPLALDLGLMAFVFIKTNENKEKWELGEVLAKIPEVLEVHDIAGEDCYLVKLRTKDTETLWRLLRDKFGNIDSIASTRTTIVLRTLKETQQLPLYKAKKESEHYAKKSRK